jgi:hypothetical protein
MVLGRVQVDRVIEQMTAHLLAVQVKTVQ